MRTLFAMVLTLAAAGALVAAPPGEVVNPVTPTGDSPLSLGLDPEPEAGPIVPEATPGKIPGGLVDAEWKRAFVPGADGLVEAIDLRTGKTLFASATRAQVLALSGDRLYVLAGAIDSDTGGVTVRVLGMSIKGQGKYDFASKPLALPDWVAAGKSNTVSGSSAMVTDGKLLLHWDAGGVEPNNMMNMRFRRGWGGEMMNPGLSAAGDFSVDLATGESKVSEPPPAPAGVPGAAPGPAVGVAPGMIVLGGFPSPAVTGVPSARLKPEAVSHGGLYYVLTIKKSGEPVLTCSDPKSLRTLWQKTLDTTPGAMPTIAGSTTVAPAGPIMEGRLMKE